MNLPSIEELSKLSKEGIRALLPKRKSWIETYNEFRAAGADQKLAHEAATHYCKGMKRIPGGL